jgi:quercetin dioxygenase-like cupin family protein
MNLDKFIKGWLVGDFEPSLIKSKDIEVGIKFYKKGDIESNHYHKIATEYTVVVSGVVKMMDTIFRQGDIAIVQPNVCNQFECIENACVVVFKTPSVVGDKYIVE